MFSLLLLIGSLFCNETSLTSIENQLKSVEKSLEEVTKAIRTINLELIDLGVDIDKCGKTSTEEFSPSNPFVYNYPSYKQLTMSCTDLAVYSYYLELNKAGSDCKQLQVFLNGVKVNEFKSIEKNCNAYLKLKPVAQMQLTLYSTLLASKTKMTIEDINKNK
jgi:hypothetical protein